LWFDVYISEKGYGGGDFSVGAHAFEGFAALPHSDDAIESGVGAISSKE